jgi:hypothetical protein
MSLARVRWTTLVTALSVTVFCFCESGCSYFQPSSTDEEMDLAEIDEPIKPDEEDVTSEELLPKTSQKKSGTDSFPKIGDRFPLSKIIENRLTQSDNEGSHISSSRAEIMMSLVIDNILADGRKQITVRYHQIRYEQEIQGNRIAYSSDQPPELAPKEALLYSGLVNNGFSFWIGSNNKVIELIGFNDFLQRCLRNVPAQHMAATQRQLESTSGEGSIANFIDDSIGMIPYDSNLKHPDISLQPGAVWEPEPQTCETPIPMVTNHRCILKELAPNSAELLLTGRISGSANPMVIHNPDGDFKVLIKGGHSTGTCRIDRKSGFPTDSRIQRSVEFVMELPDGERIHQIKETLTTLAALVEAPPRPVSSLEPRVQQTSFQNEVGGENHRRVVRAGGFRQN